MIDEVEVETIRMVDTGRGKFEGLTGPPRGKPRASLLAYSNIYGVTLVLTTHGRLKKNRH